MALLLPASAKTAERDPPRSGLHTHAGPARHASPQSFNCLHRRGTREMADRNADGVLRGSLDRRGFLRLTGVGALALGLGGPLLSACGSGSSASAAGSRTQAFQNVTT